MDSGWIKALELPAKITGGLFAASVLIWIVDGSSTLNLDDIGSWMRPLVVVLMILTGCLFVSSIIPQLWQSTESYRFKRRITAQHEVRVRRFKEDIPYLTEKEKKILGYLRHHKQKRFTGASDAGHATTLLSKGYIRFIGVRGQIVDAMDMPFEVAEHVWEVIEAQPDDFPHVPEFSDRSSGRVEMQPWRQRIF